ncbi:uncharacterized protein LOC116076504 [Mastomys coucha]|uniref:uncharacterized protein LOC116076504 n=1 Tax=Mastomys coucha TaxID=35658 RepID=UPI001262353F|nr:uncharacterized protein LOC116076504 [Mastomys coucha]
MPGNCETLSGASDLRGCDCELHLRRVDFIGLQSEEALQECDEGNVSEPDLHRRQVVEKDYGYEHENHRDGNQEPIPETMVSKDKPPAKSANVNTLHGRNAIGNSSSQVYLRDDTRGKGSQSQETVTKAFIHQKGLKNSPLESPPVLQTSREKPYKSQHCEEVGSSLPSPQSHERTQSGDKLNQTILRRCTDDQKGDGRRTELKPYERKDCEEVVIQPFLCT